jgi:hypothetical protein
LLTLNAVACSWDVHVWCGEDCVATLGAVILA